MVARATCILVFVVLFLGLGYHGPDLLLRSYFVISLGRQSRYWTNLGIRSTNFPKLLCLLLGFFGGGGGEGVVRGGQDGNKWAPANRQVPTCVPKKTGCTLAFLT